MSSKAQLSTTITASRDVAAESLDDNQVLLIVMLGNSVGQIFTLTRTRPLTVIGREDIADIQIMDAEISRRHAALRYDAKSGHYTIVDLKSRNGTRVNDVAPAPETVLEIGDMIQLGTTTVLRVSAAHETEAKYARKMYQVALRDGLTGAFNRRYFEERLNAELAFAKRHDGAMTLLLADLDHFKRVNDEFGHRAGDRILQRFTNLIQAEVRSEDVVARYGGEEFAIICRDTSENQAAVLAERLRTVVEQEIFAHDGLAITVTVSLGIAGTKEHNAYQRHELVERADKALYAAKSAGRNTWRVFEGA
jgi:diguanylate cyclase (GGDEF)-like protein